MVGWAILGWGSYRRKAELGSPHSPKSLTRPAQSVQSSAHHHSVQSPTAHRLPACTAYGRQCECMSEFTGSRASPTPNQSIHQSIYPRVTHRSPFGPAPLLLCPPASASPSVPSPEPSFIPSRPHPCRSSLSGLPHEYETRISPDKCSHLPPHYPHYQILINIPSFPSSPLLPTRAPIAHVPDSLYWTGGKATLAPAPVEQRPHLVDRLTDCRAYYIDNLACSHQSPGQVELGGRLQCGVLSRSVFLCILARWPYSQQAAPPRWRESCT